MDVTKDQNWQDELSRQNWMLFPLLTVASLRVSLTKEAQRRFTVLTLENRTHQWIEQKVEVDYDGQVGHPNPTDEEVLVALMEIFKQEEQPSRQMTVELNELLSLLRWHNWKQVRTRLQEAMQRWAHIKFTFEKGRYDEDTGLWVPHTLPILSQMTVLDTHYDLEWSEPVFASLQGVKSDINLKDYQQFHNAIARRIYQLTHTALAELGFVEYPLREFAEKDIRLRAGYSFGHIREKLQKALAELEAKEYILPAKKWDRYPYRRNGTPALRFEAGEMFRKSKAPEGVREKETYKTKDAQVSRRNSLKTDQMELYLPPPTKKRKDPEEKPRVTFWSNATSELRQKESEALARTATMQQELLLLNNVQWVTS